MASPDVIITRNNGSPPICAMQMGLIKPRAEALLSIGLNKGFQEFPINKAAFLARISNLFLEPKAICSVLTVPSGATAANHNQLRDQYKGDSLMPADARQRGLVIDRLPVQPSCLANYDWKNSQVYNGIDDCTDVTDEMTGGMPVSMYAIPMDAAALQSRFAQLNTASFYTRYSNGGPVACRSEPGYLDSYHSIYVSPLWADLDYVLRDFEGSGWSAWQLRRSCIGGDSRTYTYDDLMFDFGMRVFVPIEVQDNGVSKTATLVITSVAGASNNALAKLLPSSLPYHRMIGGEYAKEVLAQAWANGWQVR